ncbi:hypothetical protein AB1K83_00460 [Sporosarcina sp. 179-K 3D1 HS]|uniref:hypothetical protein n=1 Tax=Sporosarcina sp. 179-K 3D1 HS TaxID=3232169 RepID=UPI0039A2FBE5
MIRVIVMAFIVGITSGVGIGTLSDGPHREGAMMGLTSIGLIAAISVGVYLFDKRRIAKYEA